MNEAKNDIIKDLPEGWNIYTYDQLQEDNLIGLVRNTTQQDVLFSYKYVKMNNIRLTSELDLNDHTWVNATEEELRKYELKKGDFLFNTRNSIELVGKTCLFDLEEKNILFNNNILRTRFKNISDSRFINYQFKTSFIQEQLEGIKSGTTNVAAIYYKSLANLKLLVPDISIQHDIINQLQVLFLRIDKAIQLVQENLEHINHLLPAALNDVFENAEENGWTQYAYDNLKDDNLIGIVRNTNEQDISFPYKYVKMNNIQVNGELDLSSYTCVNASKDELKKFELRKADFLFNTRNSIELVGKTCVFGLDERNVVFNNNILRTRFKNVANPYFVAYQFKSSILKEQLTSLKSGTTNVAAIYYKSLANVKLWLPDLETQERIVKYCNKLSVQQQQLQQQYTQKLHQLKSLKASLLDAAFRGELTQQATKAKVIQLPTETLSVVAEDEEVYQTSAPLNIPQEKRAFAKQVLAGKIILFFKDDTNFTPIKFQKLQYLAEHIAQADLNWNYYYQFAGPYDNKFMHSIDTKLEKANWFTRKGKKYMPLTKSTEIDNYYKTYFNPVTPKLEKLFTRFHKASEAQSEIVATLYAVWNNLLIQKEQVSDDIIIEKFYQWSDRKGQYKEEQLVLALKWMGENDIVPVGFGKEIKKAKK